MMCVCVRACLRACINLYRLPSVFYYPMDFIHN